MRGGGAMAQLAVLSWVHTDQQRHKINFTCVTPCAFLPLPRGAPLNTLDVTNHTRLNLGEDAHAY